MDKRVEWAAKDLASKFIDPYFDHVGVYDKIAGAFEEGALYFELLQHKSPEEINDWFHCRWPGKSTSKERKGHGLPVRNKAGYASCPDCGEQLPEATDGGVYTDLSACPGKTTQTDKQLDSASADWADARFPKPPRSHVWVAVSDAFVAGAKWQAKQPAPTATVEDMVMEEVRDGSGNLLGMRSKSLSRAPAATDAEAFRKTVYRLRDALEKLRELSDPSSQEREIIDIALAATVTRPGDSKDG